MSSACEACADVPACVCGRGSLPASAPCRQTWRHARAFPPWLTNKLHALPQIALPNPYHQEGAPWAVYGTIPVAAALRHLAHRPKTRRSRSLRSGAGRCWGLRCGACARMRAQVRARPRACLRRRPADLEVHPRAPPCWMTSKAACSAHIKLPNAFHHEPPGGLWNDSGCHCLALCCGTRSSRTPGPGTGRCRCLRRAGVHMRTC